MVNAVLLLPIGIGLFAHNHGKVEIVSPLPL
jgi:hypothetical protein